MPEVVRELAQRHLRDPVEVRINTRTATVETVTHCYSRIWWSLKRARRKQAERFFDHSIEIRNVFRTKRCRGQAGITARSCPEPAVAPSSPSACKRP